MNYKLRVFFCVYYAKHYFLKTTIPKNHKIVLFCRTTDPMFFAVLPVDQKLTWSRLIQFYQK